MYDLDDIEKDDDVQDELPEFMRKDEKELEEKESEEKALEEKAPEDEGNE
jgi:hypothetical protein